MVSKLERIFAQVAVEVSPTRAEAEEEKKFARSIIAKLQQALPRDVKVIFVGSAARDTGLRGDNDIDLFAAFPKHFTREQIVKKTFGAVRKTVNVYWQEHYAEHPYLQAVIGKFKVEVIPCFAISPHEDIKSAVDRSPLHMDYLQRMLTEKQKRDVRVLKKLLKVNGIYGAEAEIGGFSGLVCEQLILNYRSLEELLFEVARWKPPVYIDIEGSWETHTKIGRQKLAEKFPDAKLVLIDAIDRNRNAAAAISAASLARFMLLCKALTKNPNFEFFREKRENINLAKLKKMLRLRETTIVAAVMQKPNVVDDILHPQLKRSEKNIARHLQLAGFEIIGSASACDEKQCAVLFEVAYGKLSAVKKLQGPPAWNYEHVTEFLKGKKIMRGPYLEEEKVYVDINRSERNVERVLRRILKDKNSGISSHFVKPAGNAMVYLLSRRLSGAAAKAVQHYLESEKITVR